MTAPLDAFFATMRPFLLGETDAAAVESKLGPSPSGAAALGYYRTLVDRNHHKILGDVFDSVRAACEQREPGMWSRLVRSYASRHPRAAHDPNDFGARFPEFVERHAWPGEHAAFGARLAQLADYHWILHRCAVAPAVADDGVEVRLFVRQYDYDVPSARRGVPRAQAELMDADFAGEVFLVVFRHLHMNRVEVLRATFPQLRVVASRAGVAAQPETSEANDDLTEAADSLVRLGVLRALAPH